MITLASLRTQIMAAAAKGETEAGVAAEEEEGEGAEEEEHDK